MDAPDRIWVTERPSITRMGACHIHKLTGSTEYIRADLMAELVEAAVALSDAYRTWSLIPRRRDGEKQAFEQMHIRKVALDDVLAKIKEPQK